MSHEGGCLCGAVRYTVDADPIITRACWCRFCQRLGAGGPTVNTGFPRDRLTVAGNLADYESTADSGNVMHRRFCPRCGAHLFSEAEARPNLVFVRAGTLDDPAIAKPAMTIWTAEAPQWAVFDPALPQYEGQPPAPSQS